ncbi:short chain enoyl-CoA hydratase [Actinomadura pelletieri DSM 43383]|uniref:enoyl-CoA hydratase n=1 Tax=Actinomadura pelletieri DSM 43383 TaxID=1120940 RepID=A0A495Q8P8_9ACTN|nr:enoyl-CoA hydratase-related protein [Actinomadura pelletieri]RKS67703.1 short chain enoyl-CoA hydratase [Actinomadura pelletieri DSM 43383]
MTDLVHVVTGPCTEIVLDNPPLNVVSRELTRQLRAALHTVARDPEVRAVVVHGAGGKAFCAGSDIAEFRDLHGRVAEDKLLLERLVYRQLATLPVPTVAAIEGHALGGGLELALCCDFRIATHRSKLGMPELKLGVTPGSGGTQRLPRIIGLARAKEMILLGEPIDAAHALAIGLVTRVADAGQAVNAAREMAETLASRGPVAMRVAKKLLDLSTDTALEDGLAHELDGSETVFATDDMLEGAAAFLAKRQARFTGR